MYGWKRDSIQLGGVLIKTPADSCSVIKCDCFYGGLPKWLKAMVAYLKASANEKTYSDYLQVVREAGKEEVMEPTCSQSTDKKNKPKVRSFFPRHKLKCTKPTKTPAVRAVLLEEEGSNEEAGAKNEVPDEIDGVMEKFIVCLVRTVKEAKKDEKHCYHCSSIEHFISKWLLVKTSRSATHLNHKEGTVPEKGAWTP